MAIRLSGMASGLDTESIVSALVSGYKTKKEKFQKAQTKLSWTQDAWKDVNKKVYSLYSGLDSLRFSSGYSLKKTTVSDPSKVSVSASGSAFNGTQKLKVNKVATTATMTGGNLGSTTSGSTKLAELGFTTNNGQITLKKGDGSEATFTAKSSSTVNDFVNFLKNNGISASYDTAQHRIYANAKDQGSKGDFTLTAENAEGLKAMSALGVNLKSDAANKVYTDLAQYANTAGADENPVYTADSETVRNNILSAISAYNTAGETIKNATVANANLQAAGNYAANYASMRDGLSDIGKSEDDADVEILRKMLRLGSGGFNNSVVGTDGNIYTLAGGTANGDTVYSYKDAETNEEKFISRHMTGDVLTESRDEYKKLDTKQKFGSDDNEIDVYQKDGDDKLYRLTSDYKLVEIEQAEGQTYYQDKAGSEAIVTEPEMEYFTYDGSAKSNLGVYTDASGNKFTEYVDDDGNKVDGIFQNGDKFYRMSAESSETTEDGTTSTTYTLTEVKLRESAAGSSAFDYEDVEDEEGNAATREATSFKADGDYYFVNNSNTTADSGIKASYKWMDDFYDAARGAHNASASDEDDWDDTARDAFRDRFNDAIQQVNYFEDHNTKELDELHSENDPDPAYSAYSVQNIMDAVKTAYDSAEAGKGAEAVNEYAEGLGAHMYTNKQAIDSAKETQEKYSNLSGLAAMDSTGDGAEAYNNAINDMVSKVLNAATIVADATSAGYNTDAAKVDGVDAEIELGGIKYTSSNNSFSINGLSIQTLAETKEGEEISITTQTDTQGLYDKIKDFISNYNDVINELTELYNASSSKGYEPLTDDEKAEMSDKQVEKWESKIKDSLLRRDQNLGNIITTMTNAMSKTYSVGGKNYSLASFGIKTLGILKAANNQQNAYHIDGDEDDTLTSANADKLMNMLTSDPDTVVSFMQQLTNGIHSSMEQKMRTSTLSSAYTIYNDKEMASEYSDYTKLIKTWETRMNDAETRYQKQFTQMEKALAQLNSNSSAVGGLFG